MSKPNSKNPLLAKRVKEKSTYKKPNSKPINLGHIPILPKVALWPHLRTQKRLNELDPIKYPEMYKTLAKQMAREKKGYDEWQAKRAAMNTTTQTTTSV